MSTNFTLVKRGYNPVEVDSYIKNLEQQLEEYREKSAAINNAIINAQLAADNIIKEAHLKTDKMLSVAETDALNLKQNTLSQLTSIKTNVANQRKLMEAFQNDYSELIKKYLSPVENSDINPMLSKLNEIDKLIDELSTTSTSHVEKTPEERAVSKITADLTEPTFYKEEKKVQPVESFKKPNPAPVNNPYAKPNDAPVNNPYAKPNDTPVSNPYAKPNDTPVNNPYAKPNDAPVNNPYAKPNNTPVSNPYANENNSGNNNAPKAPLGGGFNKSFGGLNNKISPFAKKDATSMPNNETQKTINPFAKAPAPQPTPAPVNEEMSIINEEADYSSFLSSQSTDEPMNNSYTSKPGIYKATDLYSEYAATADSGESYSNGLSKEEMDEFMPSKRN